MIQKDLHIATIKWFEYGLVSRIKNHWNAILKHFAVREKPSFLLHKQLTLCDQTVGVFHDSLPRSACRRIVASRGSSCAKATAMTMLLVGLLGPHASETRHKKVLNA